MGEFQKEVDGIVGALSESNGRSKDGRLRPNELADIVTECAEEVNCYPGYPSNKCCERAYFVSLSIKLAGSSRPHLKFEKALEQLVKHMTGPCSGVTRCAIVLTDSWDAKAFEGWRATLQRLNCYIEIYLIVGEKATRIDF